MQITRLGQKTVPTECEMHEIFQMVLKKYMTDEVEEIVNGVCDDLGVDIDVDTRNAIIAQSSDRYEHVY